MCNKSVNTSASAIQLAPECYKTQKMCVKAVDTPPFVFDFVHDQYKTQDCVIKLFPKTFYAKILP